jgi:hypothetical protein
MNCYADSICILPKKKKIKITQGNTADEVTYSLESQYFPFDLKAGK